MKPITDIDDPRLVKALAHPLRIQILNLLRDRVASPSELADEIGAPLGNVSYHVRFLARIGLIELERTRPRRGAVEHYYRAAALPEITEQAWADVPRLVRDALHGSAILEAGELIMDAARTGGFDRDHVDVTRAVHSVDEQGLAELATEIAKLRAQAEQIERRSRERLARTNGETVALNAGMIMMLFETDGADRRKSA